MACCCKCKWRYLTHFYPINKLWSSYFNIVTTLISQLYRYVMRILGPVLFVGANALILTIAAIYVVVFIPSFFHYSYTTMILNYLFGFYLLINTLFNYYSCVFTSPGIPSYCESPERIFGEKRVSVAIDGR